MSRNLCMTNCRQCEQAVEITGHRYNLPYNHFACPGLTVADAKCVSCGTRYTAWIGATSHGYGGREMDRRLVEAHGFYDLSYRSSFDDEPGEDDLPSILGDRIYEITRDIALS